MATTSFSPEVLTAFVTDIYQNLGVDDADARLIADSLCMAELWGHASHGLLRTFWYTARIQSGATRISSTPDFPVDAGAIAVIDGNNGIGQCITNIAMQSAIERAKHHGVGAIAVRNSGHFGTAMYFTKMAADNNCIGLITTNASPAMAPWGGLNKLFGTNPWSISAPAGRYPAMLLDIANTAVARGKLYAAKQKGESIPSGWATNQAGYPTTDAIEGIAGNILPMAGHKGYAIATMVDVLSGILSGSAFADNIVGPYQPEGDSGVGHFVLALNIAAFRPLADFNKDMETLIDKIRSAPARPDVDRIYYPGELESVNQEQARQNGVELPIDTIAELDAGANKLGVKTLSSRFI